jgi:hypothetical protein
VGRRDDAEEANATVPSSGQYNALRRTAAHSRHNTAGNLNGDELYTTGGCIILVYKLITDLLI